MMGLVALGVGVGFGVAMYRNLPPMPQQSLVLVLVAIVLGLGAAWLAGRRHAQSQWQMQVQAQEQEQQQHQAQQVVVNVHSSTGGPGVPALAGEGPAAQVEGQLPLPLEEGSKSLPEGSRVPSVVDVLAVASLAGSRRSERSLAATKSEGATGVGHKQPGA